MYSAFATDIADGYIARINQVTLPGTDPDPLADKLMTFTVIVSITAAASSPVGVVIFFAEAAAGVGALSMFHKIDDVMPANWLGKTPRGCFSSSALPWSSSLHPQDLGHRHDLRGPCPHFVAALLHLWIHPACSERKTSNLPEFQRIHTQSIISAL